MNKSYNNMLTKFAWLTIYNYLNGEDLLFKVARFDKEMRELLAENC